jgi:hypothetical protein
MDKIKLEHHVKHLREQLAAVDKKITDGYSHYLTNKDLGKMKFEKADIKRTVAATEEKIQVL